MDTAQLSTVVQEGLQCLHKDITADMTKKLISNAIKMALHSNVPGNPEIYATKPDYTKQAEYAVLTLFYVAIKHRWDANRVRSLLEELHVAPAAIDELVAAFDVHRVELHVHNLTTGHSLPHMTNVEWTLSCDIRSSQCTAIAGDLNYTVSLGCFREASGEREAIAEFQCNVEELQALVAKLKDIERHCEKLTTSSAVFGGPK